MGEREGRIYSSLVANRNFNLAHGIGRSGNLTALQPKARGSNIIYSLTRALSSDAMRIAGLKKSAKNPENLLLMPCATGVSLNFCFNFLKMRAVMNGFREKRIILWFRIDQGSCLKSMLLGDFELKIIQLSTDHKSHNKGSPQKYTNFTLESQISDLEKEISSYSPDKILAIHATSSCFAPREPDNIVKIAETCRKYEIPLVVNNAYGLQSSKSVNMIETAMNNWKEENSEDPLPFLVVQSMDKNFMVPVGGSIILAKNKKHIKKIASSYPGRASISSILDLAITFLEMGSKKWQFLLKNREENYDYLISKLKENSQIFLAEVITFKKNNIQVALKFDKEISEKLSKNDQNLGAKLFSRGVTGARFLSHPGKVKSFVSGQDGKTFEIQNWGAQTNKYFDSYLTLAVSIGSQKEEIDSLIERLSNLLKEVLSKL